MYAIVKTGGKQYKVEPGTVLSIEKLAAEVGDEVELPVIFVADGETIEADPEKAAAAQVLYNIIKLAHFETDQQMIDLLTMAMVTDTGQFRYVRHADVFRVAADLVDCGADMARLTNLLCNKDKKTVLVEAETVSNAQFFFKNRLALAVIKHDDYKKLDGRGEIVLNLLSQIHGVEFVVLLKEQKENQIGISIRSKTVPINQIAESFGGGGHLYAAGAVVLDSLDNVQTQIVNAFKGI